MALRTRIEPFRRKLEIITARSLSPEARSRSLAKAARTALADAQEVNRQALGETPPHETFVDGRRGAAVETVSPDGRVVFVFQLVSDIFEWIEALLILNAPVKSGRFARSFVFFADGVEADPLRPPQASEYVFLNVQPYARRIERGSSSQAPDGVFEVVAAMAARRFGNVAAVRFAYRTPVAGQIVKGKTGDRSDARTPAVVIRT